MGIFKRLFGGKKSGLETATTRELPVESRQPQSREIVLTSRQEVLLKEFADAYTKTFPGLYFQSDYCEGMANLQSQSPKLPEILSQPEPVVDQNKGFLDIMGHVLRSVGFIAEDVRTMHALDRYCKREGTIGFIEELDNKTYKVRVRLGKYGAYELFYEKTGAFKDLNATFLVEGPVIM